MGRIRLALLVLVVLAAGGPALARDPGAYSAGLIVPKKGKGDGDSSSSTTVYTCVVSDWSKPLRRPPNSGFIENRPPNGQWVCAAPRKSGGYNHSDIGTACACDAYGGRWAGRIEAG